MLHKLRQHGHWIITAGVLLLVLDIAIILLRAIGFSKDTAIYLGIMVAVLFLYGVVHYFLKKRVSAVSPLDHHSVSQSELPNE